MVNIMEGIRVLVIYRNLVDGLRQGGNVPIVDMTGIECDKYASKYTP